MAGALLEAWLLARGIGGVQVSSAGLLAPGFPAEPEACAAFPGLAGHRSRQLSTEDVDWADLVIGMTREHVREAVVRAPATFPKTFTLKEIVRRGQAMPRSPSEAIPQWMRRVAADRVPPDLLGDHPDDDVADPTGLGAAAWARTIEELDRLTASLAGMLWDPEGRMTLYS